MLIKKIPRFLTLPVLFIGQSLNAQPPDILWMQTYGDSGNDVGHSVIECTSGGYAMVGGTNSYDIASWYVYLVRTDDVGDTIWSSVYGGSGNDIGYSIAETPDQGFIITGETTSFPEFESNVYLIKTDPSGLRPWERSLSVGYIDRGLNVKPTSDGGFIIVGYTVFDYEENHKQVMVLKTDAIGNYQWSRLYGGPGDDEAYSVCEVPGEGYFVVGHTQQSSNQPTDVWLLKIDYSGDTLFTRTYGGYAGDYGRWIHNTSDGGFVITGTTNPPGGGGWDVYLCKTDSNGVLEWEQAYGGWESDHGLYVQETIDGNYFIAGYTYSFGRGHVDYYFLKVDMNGSLIWSTTAGGSSSDQGMSGLQSSDGGYVMIGYTGSFGHGLMDALLVKLEPDQVDVDDSDQHLTQPAFYLGSNYPNPFNASTLIRYTLPEPSDVIIQIYDILGRKIETIIDNKQPAGYHQVIWDAKDHSSGMYFYRIQAGEYSDTKKMVLLK